MSEGSRSSDGYGDRAESVGEFRYGPDIRTALIDGFTFLAEPVQYTVLDGEAIVEGDISLGPVADVERAMEVQSEELRGDPGPRAIVITPGSQFGWPDCTIPYQINSDLPEQDRVTDAIAEWRDKTDFTFVERNSGNAEQFPDYVEFLADDGCSANVGRRGGRQTVKLADVCTAGNCIHEIGHAAGLWHEQSRADRDAYVTIKWENIIPEAITNFTQHITDGDDVGKYDYGSIMHYPRSAFSKNGEDTIVPTDPDAQIGQRDGLSPGDIFAVNTVLCPTVPFVRELSLTLALQKIYAVGLVPKVSGYQGPGSWVEFQAPPGGRTVDRGSTVGIRMRPGPVP